MFLFLLLTVLTCSSVSGGGLCRGRATCQSLPKCGPVMALVGGMRKPLKPSVVQFLRSQQCGFANGYPEVCCGVLSHNVKLNRAPYVPVNKLSVYQPPEPINIALHPPHFDITVSTAPPGASTVPYLNHLHRNVADFAFHGIGGRRQKLNMEMYDLERTRRSKVASNDGVEEKQSEKSSQSLEIEIR